MQIFTVIAILLVSYLIGSIPSGWLVVKIASGKDVRRIGSGRVGGTNVMRAVGFLGGFLTGLLDVVKGFSSYWIVGAFLPGDVWLRVAAAAVTILGQIHSIFLIEKNEHGRWHLRGGAGGATCLGGAMALFFNSYMVIVPVGVLVFIFIGYASLTTISIALSGLAVFVYLAATGGGPWQYILYGLLSLILVLWALRPNLKRLRAGTERTVGLRAYLQKRRENRPAG